MTVHTESVQPNSTIERVRAWLEWPADALPRLKALADCGPLASTFELPAGAELRALLERLDVPPHAADEIEQSLPSADAHPEAWWLLERLYQQLTERDGSAIAPPWPAPQVTDDPLTLYFHLYVFLAAAAGTVRGHRARGIPDDITWSTLEDTGLQVAHYQTRNGRPGFDGAFWVWPHFRGEVYRLGRLQYTFGAIEFDPDEGDGFRRGDPALEVHIPAVGPMTPEACDDSFVRARAFFPQHFPDRPMRIATCASWLLDPQLGDYLGPDTNIMRFQSRFTHAPGRPRPGDDDVIRFAFGFLPDSIDDLPQRTTLERALVTHLRRGGHWHFRLGWFGL
ncbi:MAG: acyltransferase domain-containing protein [Actinomycetota bacterium]